MSAAVRPNILFICVDELRYPMHFPKGIESADKFMERFMPNVHRFLWSRGVRFSRYYTAAADCSPGRGTFVTGLYAQQTYLMVVRATKHGWGAPPPLQPAFPTYGKLLRECGYDTPYIGKWHLSDAPASSSASGYLQEYGFDGRTLPDPNGVAGQGIGEAPAPNQMDDRDIALQAIDWLKARATSDVSAGPFCLTVGFINPHDKQWFWSGPEAARAAAAYEHAGTKPFHGALQEWIDKHPGPPPRNIPREADPPPLGYDLPPNWQSKEQMTGPGVPSVASVFAELTDFACGGIGDVPALGFHTRPSLLCEGWNAAVAPYDYWTRALDMYTQAMHDVDTEIGLLLDSLTPAMLENLVIVFSSDHGEYASSHGLQGKGVTAYEETINVPLIVRDFTGRFTKYEEVERQQVASHVDLLRMFLDIANDGSSWMHDEYRQMYGSRLDLLSILRDPAAPGRAYAAYTCDETFLPAALNFRGAPTHAAALMFPEGKFTAFLKWIPFTSTGIPNETFYYDRTTAKGLLELESSPPPANPLALLALLDGEVRAPLPERYQAAQQVALHTYWEYVAIINVLAEAAVLASKTPSSAAAFLPASQPMYLPSVNAP